MFRRLIIVAALMSLCAPVAFGQSMISETVTFASVAIGLSANTLAAIQSPNARCSGTLESAAIRFTFDGTTTPTASVGEPMVIGQRITIQGYQQLANFLGIRTGATSGVIYFTCAK